METVARPQNIGERVRELRRARPMTLRELADKSGVHYVSIHRIESGTAKEPHPSTVRKLAEALGVSSEYLQTGDED